MISRKGLHTKVFTAALAVLLALSTSAFSGDAFAAEVKAMQRSVAFAMSSEEGAAFDAIDAHDESESAGTSSDSSSEGDGGLDARVEEASQLGAQGGDMAELQSVAGAGGAEASDVQESVVEATIYTDATYERVDSRPGAAIVLSGVLPQGATVSAYQVAKEDLDLDSVIVAFDITIFDGQGRVFQPAGDDGVKVKIAATAVGDAVENGETISVYHAQSSDDIEQIESVQVKKTEDDLAVEFDAPSFSVYAVVGDHPTTTYYFYDSDLKTVVSKQTLSNGEVLLAPPIPNSANGALFSGWSKTAASADAVGVPVEEVPFNQKIAVGATSSEVHLYPVFGAYNVIFKSADGSIFGKCTYPNGTVVNLDEDAAELVVSADHAWWSLANGGPAVSEIAIDGSDVEVFSVTRDGSYVDFDTDGGGYVPLQFVERGKRAVKPANPAKRGYAFKEWRVANADGSLGSAYDFRSAVTHNLTLKAVWTQLKVSYRIVYWIENDEGGYTYHSTETVANKVDAGTSVNTSGFTVPTGGDLKYYEVGKVTSNSDTYNGDGSTVVNVYCDKKTYTMNFKITANNSYYADYGRSFLTGYPYHNIGTVYVNGQKTYSIKVKLGDSLLGKWPMANTITGTYYYDSFSSNTRFMNGKAASSAFYGWSGGGTINVSGITDVTPEVLDAAVGTTITYNAYWYNNLQPVTLNYWKNIPGQPLEPRTSDNYTLINSIKANSTGSSFVGKELKGLELVYPADSADAYPAGLSEYNFYYKNKSYNFEMYNDGVAVSKASLEYGTALDGYYFAPVAPAGKEDFTFDGWYTSESFAEDARFDDGSFGGKVMPEANVALYAKWIPPKYTVSFYLNRSDAQPYQVQEVAKYDKMNPPVAPKREGFVFNGWVVGDYGYDDYRQRFDYDKAIDKDYHLYASWVRDTESSINVHVTYHANGGVGTVPADETDYLPYAQAFVMNPIDLTNPANGMRFTHWNTKADGTGKSYAPGEYMEIGDADVILYAQWDASRAVTLTYDFAGGTFGGKESLTVDVSSDSYAQDSNIAYVVDSAVKPTRSGYAFVGWSVQASPDQVIAAGDEIQVDTVDMSKNKLVALWEKEKIVVPAGIDGMPGAAPFVAIGMAVVLLALVIRKPYRDVNR